MYKMSKRKCLQCRGPVSQTRGPAVSSSDPGPKMQTVSMTYSETEQQEEQIGMLLSKASMGIVMPTRQTNSDDDALNYTTLMFTEMKSTKPRRQRREQRKKPSTLVDSSRQDVTCCALNKDVIQTDPVIVTRLGQSVTLTCFCQLDLLIRVSWFKQSVGQKPLLMASSYYLSKHSLHFTKDFNETKRLSVKRGVDSFNLTISKTESGDSAIYYCGAMEAGQVTFGEGTFLIVKDSGSNSMSVLQQPLSESVQLGESVTLNCTIHTETCAGEYSVYWFRQGSGESRPGIIYTLRDKSDWCEKSPEACPPEAGSPTQSCVYNLPKRNLSLSDAGTYYCAVASCGEILFGNGTKLDVEVSDLLGDKSNLVFFVFISGLTTAVILSVIVNIILCVIMKRSRCEHCAAGSPFQQSHYGNPHSNTSDQQLHGDDDGLNYAGLKFTDKKPRRQRREQREEETIYSGVSYQVRM
ncbi:uncharacterized protein LOC110531683 isoform X2 [Oncorhynchus mykiss]|uniref:uncharacterized protein LOC110531683 isoform X2 n=1 Tax=Oncorhynchus mykiss TaxID=8022 RepID=UPI00187768FA|nr:uncharacterized protein LOC110531683 isoform X2 [Oncorhynchus mykiss]